MLLYQTLQDIMLFAAGLIVLASLRPVAVLLQVSSA